MNKEYIEGAGCTCYAHCGCECGCRADWTPSEVYTLRGRVKVLEDALNTIHQINTGHTQDLHIDDVIEGVMKYDYGRMYE